MFSSDACYYVFNENVCSSIVRVKREFSIKVCPGNFGLLTDSKGPARESVTDVIAIVEFFLKQPKQVTAGQVAF